MLGLSLTASHEWQCGWLVFSGSLDAHQFAIIDHARPQTFPTDPRSSFPLPPANPSSFPCLLLLVLLPSLHFLLATPSSPYKILKSCVLSSQFVLLSSSDPSAADFREEQGSAIVRIRIIVYKLYAFCLPFFPLIERACLVLLASASAMEPARPYACIRFCIVFHSF